MCAWHRKKSITFLELGGGGHGFRVLSPEERLMHLLGEGTRHVIHFTNEKTLYLVQFEDEQLGKIFEVFNDYKLDIKQLDGKDITEAIMRLFSGNDQVRTPPKDQCYLAVDAFRIMKELMCLPIDVKDFYVPLMANEEILPQVVEAVRRGDHSIKLACLKLISKLLQAGNK